ncbi:MAG: HAD family hydrolase [Gammaproteobacteria bacterium]
MPTPWRPRAITLDLDDTLWPVKPALIHAERTLSAWLAERAPATAAWMTPDNRRMVREALLAGHPDRAHDVSFMCRESLRMAMADAGDDPGLADEAFAVFLAARQRVELFEDALPALERLSARYPLVALSNGNADVHAVGLGAYFCAAVSAHEAGCAKPDPRMFHEACRLAGAAPEEVLHLGDDPHLDVLGARRAGLQAAWVRRPQFAHRHPVDAVDPEVGPAFEDLRAIDAMLGG